MLDRALNSINQVQSYYFQLIPLSLTIRGANSQVPTPGTTYHFAIFKGEQKFDETRLPIDANYQEVNHQWVMPIPKAPLNFYIPNYNRQRKITFNFHMFQNENKQDYFIGSFPIALDDYVTAFQQERKVRFEECLLISEDYEFEYQVYLEKTRFALQKAVKEYKNQRDLKSPLRQRGSESQSQELTHKREEHPMKEKSEPLPKTSARPPVYVEKHAAEETPEEPEKVIQASRETSAKNAPSVSSVKKAPSVTTKIKPLGPKDAVRESRMTSNRVIEKEQEEPVAKSEGQSMNEKAGMVVFLLVSMVLIYLTMTPTRRV